MQRKEQRRAAAVPDPVALQPRLFPLDVDDTTFTSDDYYSPQWLFDIMGIEFDLDPCAPVGGVPWIPARRHFTIADDGLAQPWHGRVWLNPPYSNTAPWVDRFINHGDGVCIVPHSRARWHARLWASSAVLVNVHVGETMFQFHRASDGAAVNVYMPVVVAAFGADCVEAAARLGVARCVAR